MIEQDPRRRRVRGDGLGAQTVGDAFTTRLNKIAGNDPDDLKTVPNADGANVSFAEVQIAHRLDQLGVTGEAAASARDLFRALCWKGIGACDSPIERRLLPWLLAENYGPDFLTVPPRLHLPKEDDAMPEGDLVIVPQFAIAKFRIDFCIVMRLHKRIGFVGVECDGDDFHGAAKDRVRDAYLGGWRIPIIRSSGRAIKENPGLVSARVAEAAISWGDENK